MTIDFDILNTIEPLPNDYREMASEIDVDKEIETIQKEIDSISTEKIPFDLYDYICIFATAVVEVFTDFCTCDPTKEYSLAAKFNSSDNWFGKNCNKYIHDKINHANNPLDFQGRFNEKANNYLAKDIWGKQYPSQVETIDS